MTRGNRTPREKKAEEEKSKVYPLRLHPDNPEEAWAMERIEHYKSIGTGLRQLFVDALAALEDHPLPVRSIDVNGGDVLEIRQLVQYIADQLESGNWVQSGSTPRRGKKEKSIELPSAVQSTLNRYIGGGISAEDEE